MPNPVEFYFDFSSPYGYFGATRISAIAAKHRRTVAWKPILLGAVFKVTGMAPLPSLPLKGDYSVRDIKRVSRLWKIPFNMPSKFPIAGQAPSRIVYWLAAEHPAKIESAILALFHGFFVEDRDISTAETAADVVSSLGIDRNAVLAATQDPVIKDKLRQEVEAAIAKGVFGSPYIVIDGEPFWGTDRLDHAERWLATGGW
jgi:2-hydroxychromene-2-carboxylate isomerase